MINNIQSVIIPYHHQDLDLKCDFIFQTVKELQKRSIKVTVLLRQHFIWFPIFLFNFFWKRHHLHLDISADFDTNNLKVFKTPVLIPTFLNFLPGMMEINRRFSLFILKHFISYQSADIFWNFDPFNIDLLKEINELKITTLFDCVDYYTSIIPEKKIEIEDAFHESLKQSNVVCANSHVLYSFCNKLNKNTHLVPQGFDEETFLRSEFDLLPDVLKKDRRKKIGFVGNLTYRIDYELLNKLIAQHPNHLFLISDTYLPCDPEDSMCDTEKMIEELKRYKNIFWIPKLARRNLIPYIKALDIGIIPYDIRFQFNTYCYPMKLFEYFYIGKPVISTPIEELKRFPRYVKIGSTAQEWEKQIKESLAKPWSERYKQQQRKLAEENIWEKKVSSILKIIFNNERKETRHSHYLP